VQDLYEDFENQASRESLDFSNFNMILRGMAKVMVERSLTRSKRNAASRVIAKFVRKVEVTATTIPETA